MDDNRKEALAADLRTKSDHDLSWIIGIHEAATILRKAIKDSGEDPFFVLHVLEGAISTTDENFETASKLFADEKARRAAETSANDVDAATPVEDATAA